MKTVLAIVAALILAGIAGVAGVLLLNSPSPDVPADGVVFEVKSGENLAVIAARLDEAGLIRSRWLLRALARIEGTEASLKAGFYRILADQSTTAVHDLLVEGRQDEVVVTIPEGWTSRQIARYLEEQGIVPAHEFERAVGSAVLALAYGVPGETLEGYLYPDTYRISRNMPARLIAQKMTINFFSKLGEIFPGYESLDREILQRRVIMASIVEREYRVAEEAPYIASVFYNRLKYDIGLESCATIAYIITDVEGNPHPDVITREDLKIDSPYNTYKWAGLPPGPISNPGSVALAAAFHPADTEFYYFLLKDPSVGTHYFSEDLEEHNQAKRFYIKGIGS